MQLQGIADHVQQTYLSQGEPYAQCLTYYMQDSKSDNHKTHGRSVTDDLKSICASAALPVQGHPY